jgi:hypothetical protein
VLSFVRFVIPALVLAGLSLLGWLAFGAGRATFEMPQSWYQARAFYGQEYVDSPAIELDPRKVQLETVLLFGRSAIAGVVYDDGVLVSGVPVLVYTRNCTIGAFSGSDCRVGVTTLQPRTLTQVLEHHIETYRQMAFVAGPRQVGKTTVCRTSHEGARTFNWDDEDDRTFGTGQRSWTVERAWRR